MNLLSSLMIVLLVLAGYSMGAVIGGKGRTPAPRVLDCGMVIVLWVAALLSRVALGKWAAIGIWMVTSGLVSLGLTAARRGKLPAIRDQGAVPAAEGPLLRRLWEGWKRFTAAFGGYQGRILLILFYFLVVTPFGVLVSLLSDPLGTRPVTALDFWNDRPVASGQLDEARRQF
jgi:hypothetical protein